MTGNKIGVLLAGVGSGSEDLWLGLLDLDGRATPHFYYWDLLLGGHLDLTLLDEQLDGVVVRTVPIFIRLCVIYYGHWRGGREAVRKRHTCLYFSRHTVVIPVLSRYILDFNVLFQIVNGSLGSLALGLTS